MNSEPVRERSGLAYTLAVLGAFLIVAALVYAMRHFTQPPPVEDRPAARAKALAELRAAEKEALETVAWIDQGKGLVRLRVQDAMKLVERDWGQNPAAARANLIAREEKATAKAPEKPSQFE
jgi:hypothetical protein